MREYHDVADVQEALREKLTECVEIARALLDESLTSYGVQTTDDYGLNVYIAVKTARDIV